MSKKYIIGIDGGSQSTKVVMYDLSGNVVCEGKGPLQPMYTPDADTVEHPDDDLWTSLCAAGKELMAQFSGNVADIVGIGLGSIRCCRALLKADGTPAAQLISWQDSRVTRPYEHDNKEVAYVTSFSGYLSHRLTGEFKDNIANYFGQWPVDYKTWSWSEDPEVIKNSTSRAACCLKCKCRVPCWAISPLKRRKNRVPAGFACRLQHKR